MKKTAYQQPVTKWMGMDSSQTLCAGSLGSGETPNASGTGNAGSSTGGMEADGKSAIWDTMTD